MLNQSADPACRGLQACGVVLCPPPVSSPVEAKMRIPHAPWLRGGPSRRVVAFAASVAVGGLSTKCGVRPCVRVFTGWSLVLSGGSGSLLGGLLASGIAGGCAGGPLQNDIVCMFSGGRCGRLGTAGSGCPRGALLMICRLNTRAWFGCAYDQLPARCMGDVGSEQSPVVAAYPTSQTRKNKSGSTIRNNSNET